MGNMKKTNYIISAITLVLGILMVAMASKFKIKFGSGDPGAGFWPAILGGFMILLAILLLVTTLKNKAAMEEKIFTIFLPANKRVYQVMAVVAAFCVVLYFFGFYIGALLFIPIVMYIMEARRPKKIIITTVATVAGIYVVFAILLKISLPAPFFMQ